MVVDLTARGVGVNSMIDMETFSMETLLRSTGHEDEGYLRNRVPGAGRCARLGARAGATISNIGGQGAGVADRRAKRRVATPVVVRCHRWTGHGSAASRAAGSPRCALVGYTRARPVGSDLEGHVQVHPPHRHIWPLRMGRGAQLESYRRDHRAGDVDLRGTGHAHPGSRGACRAIGARGVDGRAMRETHRGVQRQRGRGLRAESMDLAVPGDHEGAARNGDLGARRERDVAGNVHQHARQYSRRRALAPVSRSVDDNPRHTRAYLLCPRAPLWFVKHSCQISAHRQRCPRM